jgi:hypothetical protein
MKGTMESGASDTAIFLESIRKLESWVEAHDYKAYEPFDGQSSILKPLTFNNLLAERVLQQIVRRSPVNVRPLIGVRPQESTKGRGYMAWGYLKMFRITGDPTYKNKALVQLDWLDSNRSPFYRAHSWGNHFAFSGRKVRTRKFEPIIVWTSLIGQAFLDAFELFGLPRHREVGLSICDWIMGLPRERTPEGHCISYVAYEQSSIHNSNMLGAAYLARAGKLFGREDCLDIARQAMDYSCARQRPDGSWFYAESPNCHWIDNFHTGYNLDSLKGYIDVTGETGYEGHLAKGLAFYKENLFKADGTPKYYHDRTFPIDSQCASQAVDTLATFSAVDPTCMKLAVRTALWTIRNMQDGDGHFYYHKLRFMTVKTPMLHWAQATMYNALANLIARMQRSGIHV